MKLSNAHELSQANRRSNSIRNALIFAIFALVVFSCGSQTYATPEAPKKKLDPHQWILKHKIYTLRKEPPRLGSLVDAVSPVALTESQVDIIVNAAESNRKSIYNYVPHLEKTLKSFAKEMPGEELELKVLFSVDAVVCKLEENHIKTESLWSAIKAYQKIKLPLASTKLWATIRPEDSFRFLKVHETIDLVLQHAGYVDHDFRNLELAVNQINLFLKEVEVKVPPAEWPNFDLLANIVHDSWAQELDLKDYFVQMMQVKEMLKNRVSDASMITGNLAEIAKNKISFSDSFLVLRASHEFKQTLPDYIRELDSIAAYSKAPGEAISVADLLKSSYQMRGRATWEADFPWDSRSCNFYLQTPKTFRFY